MATIGVRDPRGTAAHLPRHPQRELQNPWIAGAGDLHEVAAGLHGRRQIEIHAIERVEGFEPERYGNPLGDGEALRQAEVYCSMWFMERYRLQS